MRRLRWVLAAVLLFGADSAPMFPTGDDWSMWTPDSGTFVYGRFHNLPWRGSPEPRVLRNI